MEYLKKRIGKYTGFLRSFKPIYTLNNLLQKNKLEYNKQQLRKYGIKHSAYTSIGKKDLEGIQAPGPWLDGPGALKRMRSHPDFKSFSSEIQQAMEDFVELGMMNLSNFFNKE